MADAVCCDDGEHCCPQSLPVCDTFAGRCLPQVGSLEGSLPWATKTPAHWRGGPFRRAAAGKGLPEGGGRIGLHAVA